MTGEEYARAIKVSKLHKKMMFIQMNESQINNKEIFNKAIADIEQELEELKNEGDK